MKAIVYVGFDRKKHLIVCDDYKIDYEDKDIYFLKDNDEQKIVFEEFKGVLI